MRMCAAGKEGQGADIYRACVSIMVRGENPTIGGHAAFTWSRLGVRARMDLYG
jgi:hypothetical protein